MNTCKKNFNLIKSWAELKLDFGRKKGRKWKKWH
jgi:hypothetical protein